MEMIITLAIYAFVSLLVSMLVAWASYNVDFVAQLVGR